MKKDKETQVVKKLHLSVQDIEKVSEKYCPEGFDTVEEYLEDMRENYTLDLQADDDNRIAALEDKKFTAGEQWDPQVLLQRQGLPCLTINTIPQFVAQLVGDWRTNRNAVKVLPAESGDRDVADVRSDLIRSIETRQRATRVYDNAFESMIQCGDGAFKVGVQYAKEDVFDQEIVLQPIDDALSVVWDRMSIDSTGRDARRCFVDDSIPEKEFKAQWPEADPSDLNNQDRKTMLGSGWLETGNVRVTEHWRMIERKKLLMMFEDGKIYHFEEDMDPGLLDKYIEKHGQPMKSRIAPCQYAQMHLVTGFKILAGPYEWKMNRLPIIRMAGRHVSIGERRVRYGLVRYMKDAARLRNFWRSIAAEQLGYAPKAQWLATDEAVEGREDAFRNAHKVRDPLLIYNEGAEAPQRIDAPQMQMALLNEAQVNTQDMKDVTGIHDASLGIKSNETSGRAIMARQREGDIASLAYYDNGNAAILEAGDVINQLIGQVYDGTRIIRIIGEDEQPKLVNVNDDNDPDSPDLSVGTYDVAITTGASYTTRRVEAAEAMMEAVQVFPQMMEVAGDLVAKAQDWPGAEELADRLRKTVPPQLLSDKERDEMGAQAPDAQAAMQQQAAMQEQMQGAMEQLQKLTEENTSLKLKVEIESRKLDIEEFNAETERIKTLADIASQDKDYQLRELENAAQMENALHGRVMDGVDRLQGAENSAADREDRAADREAKANAVKPGVEASTQPSE